MAKYVGPKTDPANVATQADIPSAPTTASAGTITGTNAEGTSTSFARADHDHAYGSLSIPNSALALGPTYETSLPGSPVDGQEIYYAADAANSIIWHLRYRSGASGSYKWEFVGGGALFAVENAERSITNQTSFIDVPTDTIVLTIPLAGEYVVEDHLFIQVSSGNNNIVRHGYAITDASNAVQTEADIEKVVTLVGNSTTSAFAITTSASSPVTITTAGWKLRERAVTVGNYTGAYRRRRVFVRPIRVG